MSRVERGALDHTFDAVARFTVEVRVPCNGSTTLEEIARNVEGAIHRTVKGSDATGIVSDPMANVKVVRATRPRD